MAFAMALNREDDCKKTYARIQLSLVSYRTLASTVTCAAAALEAVRCPITPTRAGAKRSRLGPSPPRALRRYGRHKGEVH